MNHGSHTYGTKSQPSSASKRDNTTEHKADDRRLSNQGTPPSWLEPGIDSVGLIKTEETQGFCEVRQEQNERQEATSFGSKETRRHNGSNKG